jgi:hypothetical protein
MVFITSSIIWMSICEAERRFYPLRGYSLNRTVYIYLIRIIYIMVNFIILYLCMFTIKPHHHVYRSSKQFLPHRISIVSNPSPIWQPRHQIKGSLFYLCLQSFVDPVRRMIDLTVKIKFNIIPKLLRRFFRDRGRRNDPWDNDIPAGQCFIRKCLPINGQFITRHRLK